MSRLDVVKSLLRSTARGATGRFLPAAKALAKAIRNPGLGRLAISSAQLTAAVVRAAEASAATVSAAPEVLRVDIALTSGAHLAVQLRLAGVVFATGGAKELAFETEPLEAGRTPACRDAVAAIAAEIARTLWKPALLGAPETGPAAFVALDADRLVVDLRTVPEVRWALRQRMPATVIELLRPRQITITQDGIELQIALNALRAG